MPTSNRLRSFGWLSNSPCCKPNNMNHRCMCVAAPHVAELCLELGRAAFAHILNNVEWRALRHNSIQFSLRFLLRCWGTEMTICVVPPLVILLTVRSKLPLPPMPHDGAGGGGGATVSTSMGSRGKQEICRSTCIGCEMPTSNRLRSFGWLSNSPCCKPNNMNHRCMCVAAPHVAELCLELGRAAFAHILNNVEWRALRHNSIQFSLRFLLRCWGTEMTICVVPPLVILLTVRSKLPLPPMPHDGAGGGGTGAEACGFPSSSTYNRQARDV